MTAPERGAAAALQIETATTDCSAAAAPPQDPGPSAARCSCRLCVSERDLQHEPPPICPRFVARVVAALERAELRRRRP